MAKTSFSVSDFSGGLNTSISESRLAPHMTASLTDVDILDSRAISRRHGYYTVTATPIRDARVNDLYLLYTQQGGKMWFSLAGTGVHKATLSSLTVNETVEAETLATLTTLSWSGFSGGAAALVSATTTIPIPSCTNIRVKTEDGVGGNMTMKVDAGSYITATGGYFSFANLSATSHTLTARPTTTRNASSLGLFINPTGRSSISASSAGMNRDFIGNHRYSVWVRDFAKPNDEYFIGLAGAEQFCDFYGAAMPNTFWLKFYNDGVYSMDGARVASRSVGWHEVVFDYMGYNPVVNGVTYDGAYCAVYYDGVLAGQSLKTNYTDGLTYFDTSGHIGLKFYCRSRLSEASTMYVDDMRINGRLVNDFGSTSGLRIANYSSTGTMSISTGYWHTGDAQGVIDTINYSANPAYTRVASLSASNPYMAATTHANKVYFGSAYNAIRSYDGTTVAAITASGAAPPAKFLVNFKRRLFAAGKYTDPTLLEYTAIDQPNDWSNGGALRITGKDAGGECTGLVIWNNILWWFAPSKLHALDTTGSETSWVNKQVSDKYGCIAPRSLAAAPQSLIFLSAYGLRAYGTVPGIQDDDGSGFTYLSEAIQPSLDGINMNALDRVCGCYYNDRYYISVPLGTATENNMTFVLKMADDGNPPAWTRYSYGVTCFCLPRGDDGGMYGGTTTGYIRRLEVGNSDDGAAISMYYRTPPLTSDGYSTVKHYRKLYTTFGSVAASAANVTVTPYTDSTNGLPISIAASSSTVAVRSQLNARGRSIGLEFESSGRNDLSISEATVTFVEPRMR